MLSVYSSTVEEIHYALFDCSSYLSVGAVTARVQQASYILLWRAEQRA